MNNKDIIIRIRKENNLTQEELAKNINVSRETISKWERGTNSIPEDLFDEIIKKYHYKINKKIPVKKLIIYISSIIFIISFICLLFYFLLTYKKTRIYELSGYKDGITVNNGLLVITNNKIYLKLNQLEMDSNIQLKYIELYYNYNNKKHYILKMDSYENNLNIQIVNEYGNNELFSRKETLIIQKNLYINFIFGDNTETTINIKPVLTYINSFTYNRNKENNEAIEEKKNNISNKITKNFIYNKKGKSYVLESDNLKIEYLLLTDTLIIHDSDNSIYTYYFNDKTLYYLNNEQNFTYNFIKMECMENICSKNIINKFNKYYENYIE